jgi:hypothetical protein
MKSKIINAIDLLAYFNNVDDNLLQQLREDWPAYCRYIENLAKLKIDREGFERFSMCLKKIICQPGSLYDINHVVAQATNPAESRADMILEILRDVGRPITAKEIKNIYINMCIENGDVTTIKRGLQCALSRLKKKGKVAIDDDGNYYAGLRLYSNNKQESDIPY